MLDSQTLINTASEQSGLSDFGDPSFREGLDILVGALNTEAKLTEAASGRVGASIVATLVNRLQVEDYLKAHPELLDAPIEKPTFVFGLPRTGTTLAINLLTADPARRSASAQQGQLQGAYFSGLLQDGEELRKQRLAFSVKEIGHSQLAHHLLAACAQPGQGLLVDVHILAIAVERVVAAGGVVVQVLEAL